ncbi:Imm43 family immunity protein [Sphingobacterium suaedae]|uniref:Imm43 family immunity protein n=1 Tax=Sphingobacterium suaedae TaxID=1686402 RepID=A0ABW5KQE5_9SPHI
MEKLMISLIPWKGEPTAPPYMDSTFSERVDSKDPYNKPVYSNNWFEYSPMRAGKPVPLTDDYKLPESFYWICPSVRKLDTDYYDHSKGVILSKDLFDFLQGFSNEDEYEKAQVIPVSGIGERISEKDYLFQRFLRQKNKDYIDFERSPRHKRANKTMPLYLYPDFNLKTTNLPDYFWIKNQLVAEASVAEQINSLQLKGFKMVSLDTYLEEIDFRDRHPYPDLKTMLGRDIPIFG